MAVRDIKLGSSFLAIWEVKYGKRVYVNVCLFSTDTTRFRPPCMLVDHGGECSSCLPYPHLYVPIRSTVPADVTSKVLQKVLYFLNFFPFPVLRCLPHYPVDDKQDQKGRQQATLAHSCEHLKQFWKNSVVDDSTGALLIGFLCKYLSSARLVAHKASLLCKGDVFLWDAILA